MAKSSRAEHEIAHGRKLSESGAEQIWGWGTPAGQIRSCRRADWIMQAAVLKPGMHVLEIGCGTGNFTESFAKSGAQITALDISEELLIAARKRSLPGTVTFVCMPFESLGLDESFDAVIGSSVLHHLDIELALTEIYHLLRPGGVMAFAEPNMLNPQVMVEMTVPWIKERMGVSPDEKAFFRWEIKRLMRETGFAEIAITPLDWLHPATPTRVIEWARKIGAVLEKTPLIREIAGSLYIFGQRPAQA